MDVHIQQESHVALPCVSSQRRGTNGATRPSGGET